MKILKRHLEPLFLAVKGTEGVLNLSESRLRDSFFKPLTEATQLFEGQRRAIYEMYCLKNEDGSADTSDGNYHFEKNDVETVNKELNVLLDEEAEVEAPAGLKAVIEKTTYSPKVGEVEVIDTFLAQLNS